MDNNETPQNSAVMTIDIGLTHQPRAYQSVRVGVTLPVFVTAADDVMALLKATLSEAKHLLEEEIDLEFESYDEPAVYSNEPRFMLALIRDPRIAAIVPSMKAEKLPGGWQHARFEVIGHRLGYVHDKAAEWDEYTIIDASDGDLSRLPAVERYTLYRSSKFDLNVLVKHSDEFEARNNYPGYWNTHSYLCRPDDILDKVMQAVEGMGFFDCTDGDFSKLPPPPVPEPEPVVEPNDLEDDEDDLVEDEGYEDDE